MKSTHYESKEILVQLPMCQATVADFYHLAAGAQKLWNIGMPFFILNKDDHLECYVLRYPVSSEKRFELKQLISLNRVFVFKPTEIDDADEMIKIIKPKKPKK